MKLRHGLSRVEGGCRILGSMADQRDARFMTAVGLEPTT
jgi:hypothetical protein